MENIPDPATHEFRVRFPSVARAALAEHADELGISLEEHIQRSAISRALQWLEERRHSGGMPAEIEATPSRLFGAHGPDDGHNAWANRALGGGGLPGLSVAPQAWITCGSHSRTSSTRGSGPGLYRRSSSSSPTARR
jgi:hypothetical protein